VRSSFRIGFAVFVLLAASVPGAGRDAASPLSRPISHFSIGKTSVLDALFWLGRDERVCIGIEFSGNDLSRDVQVDVDQSTIGEVVKKILGSSDAYQLSVSDGVILIRKKGVNPPAWLDHRLPEFELPRTELMWADIRLSMALERDLSPSLQGFAGDSPGTDPIDEVGPFHERRRTVRQLPQQDCGWVPGRKLVPVRLWSSSLVSSSRQPLLDLSHIHRANSGTAQIESWGVEDRPPRGGGDDARRVEDHSIARWPNQATTGWLYDPIGKSPNR